MVNYVSQNITKDIETYIKTKGVVFNPSIAHFNEFVYIVSVRNYVYDNFAPKSKNQHPWKRFWKSGEHTTDSTYIFPAEIKDNSFESIETSNWPIVLNVQDLRIFKLYSDKEISTYILTYNNVVSNVEIKNDDCSNRCYIINWSYLVVKSDLSYNIIHSEKPLCTNISEKTEKNWSLWSIIKNDEIKLMISYLLTPAHLTFNWFIDDIENSNIKGGYDCKLLEPTEVLITNVLFDIQSYYKDILFVSLGTPAVLAKDNYLGVGHIKVLYKELDKFKNSNLYNFFNSVETKLHPNYIYFMFFYTFDENSILLKVSPCFVIDTLLNFPCGLTRDRYRTFVSYGSNDEESHILKMSNRAVNSLLVDVEDIKPEKYEFGFLELL
jgi:hypothetical protein